MAVDTLRGELLALGGVADADVEMESGQAVPRNVRVRLHPEADPRTVGADVQRILAAHGMRSRISGDDAPPPPAAPPPREHSVPPRPEVPPPLPGPPPPLPPPVAPPVMPAPTATPATAAPGAPDPTARLASLTVEESAAEVVVVATATDGRRFSQRTGTTEDAVAAAVVAVVGALAEGRPPRLLATMLGAAEGTEVATVLLERIDGTRVAGAAVVRAGRPYAVARAAWSALGAR